MARWRVGALAALFALASVSCSSTIDEQDTTTSVPETSTTVLTADESPIADASYVFDQGELRTYELVISEDNLAFLDNDPAAEEWVDGTLLFEGQELPGIGVRYKGSIGAFVGCLDGPNPFEPSGAKSCTKLSMKLKFNHTDPDSDFYGLRRLQFHAMNLDPTQMRERLGYWLFREMGVPAPRAVHAKLVINGEFVGVFALVEQIDGRFTRARFEDGTGNLYKEAWPTFSENGVDVASSTDAFRNALKTNEDDDPSFELIESFGREIVAASADERPAVLAEYVNVDALVSYAVVDRTIRHDDGPFHFYCDGRCEPHNFYWYEDPSTQKLNLVAWDLDNAFENIRNARNPVTPIPHRWDEQKNDCQPFQAGGFFLEQRSAACDPVFEALTAYSAQFAAQSNDFLEGPFSEANVAVLLEMWADQIAEVTDMADELHQDALSASEWKRALDSLERDLAFARVEIQNAE